MSARRRRPARFGDKFFFATIGEAVDAYLEPHLVKWVDWEDWR